MTDFDDVTRGILQLNRGYDDVGAGANCDYFRSRLNKGKKSLDHFVCI